VEAVEEEEMGRRVVVDLEDVAIGTNEDDLVVLEDMSCGEQDMSSGGLLPSSTLIPTDMA
jgi:hypothetical protein